MADTTSTNRVSLLTVALAAEELAALSAAAKRAGVSPARLGQVLIAHGLTLLGRGDAEIARALQKNLAAGAR